MYDTFETLTIISCGLMIICAVCIAVGFIFEPPTLESLETCATLVLVGAAGIVGASYHASRY